MNFSCLPVSLYPALSSGDLTLNDWFRFAHELGLDGADISIAHITSRSTTNLSALRRQAADNGVQIAMLVTYADFTHPNADERRRQIELLRANIETAALLGSSFLRVTAGQAHPDVSEAAGIDWAVHGLTSCLGDAAAAGVTLCYENHTIGYGWTHYDFSLPAPIFLEIARRTEWSALRILFDTANTLATDDDPLAVLDAVLDRVSMVHVSDIRRAGHFEPVVIGSGIAPIGAIFERLKSAGYHGWISVEEASGSGEKGFRSAVETCKRLWQDMERQPTKDD
jgi:sugar phosphate isomerase/epimerase